MPLWKQATMSIVLLLAAILAASLFLPSTHPFLTKVGLSGPLSRMGLLVEAAAPESLARPGASEGRGAAPVVVASAAREEMLNDTVTAIGTGRGVRSVVLASDVAGRIVSLNVASGDFVQAGATILELDDEAARIAVDRAGLVLRDAEATLDRVTRLRATGASSDLQMQEADLALKTARLELREAEFDLSRHRIVAPISGWVGILTVEVGNQVAANAEITRIEDRSSLLVDFRVPERIVSLVTLGDAVSASLLAEPSAVFAGKISALDNRVDETSRTLKVQAAIDNADDAMRPGMAFLISLDFAGAAHTAVDPLAIQWGAGGPFIWIVRDGKAERAPLRILQRNSDKVLIDADLKPGDLVVREGVQTLRPGGAVSVVPEGGEAVPTKS